MLKTVRLHLTFVLLLLVILLMQGCAYLRDRGNDAMDMVDIGITVNDRWKPQFGLYLDFFSLLPLGYSRVEAKSIGIGNSQIGLLDFEHASWGALAWGSEKKGSGTFNPLDPHQARSDQTGETARPRYNAGIARLRAEDNPPPTLQFFECDRILHLGWIGFHATVRPLDIFDFILGWTTIDILGDDDLDMSE